MGYKYDKNKLHFFFCLEARVSFTFTFSFSVAFYLIMILVLHSIIYIYIYFFSAVDKSVRPEVFLLIGLHMYCHEVGILIKIIPRTPLCGGSDCNENKYGGGERPTSGERINTFSYRLPRDILLFSLLKFYIIGLALLLVARCILASSS